MMKLIQTLFRFPVLLLVGAALIGSLVMVRTFKKRQETSDVITIGILQTALHPALDLVREGFVERVTEALGDTISFIVQNAEGSITQAQSIAEGFAANRSINALFTIATPALQVAHQVEKNKPIIFAAVTDPCSLGILGNGTHVCGVHDMIDLASLAKLVRIMVPEVKSAAILFSTSSAQVEIMVKKMEKELQKCGIKPMLFGVACESDLHTATMVASQKADVIMAPLDNIIAMSIPLISRIALENSKPFIGSDTLWVAQGALAACGVDYHVSGRQTADMALSVLLEGKRPAEIPLGKPNTSNIYINKSAFEKLGLSMPSSLVDNVTWVSAKEEGA